MYEGGNQHEVQVKVNVLSINVLICGAFQTSLELLLFFGFWNILAGLQNVRFKTWESGIWFRLVTYFMVNTSVRHDWKIEHTCWHISRPTTLKLRYDFFQNIVNLTGLQARNSRKTLTLTSRGNQIFNLDKSHKIVKNPQNLKDSSCFRQFHPLQPCQPWQRITPLAGDIYGKK